MNDTIKQKQTSDSEIGLLESLDPSKLSDMIRGVFGVKEAMAGGNPEDFERSLSGKNIEQIDKEVMKDLLALDQYISEPEDDKYLDLTGEAINDLYFKLEDYRRIKLYRYYEYMVSGIENVSDLDRQRILGALTLTFSGHYNPNIHSEEREVYKSAAQELLNSDKELGFNFPIEGDFKMLNPEKYYLVYFFTKIYSTFITTDVTVSESIVGGKKTMYPEYRTRIFNIDSRTVDAKTLFKILENYFYGILGDAPKKDDEYSNMIKSNPNILSTNSEFQEKYRFHLQNIIPVGFVIDRYGKGKFDRGFDDEKGEYTDSRDHKYAYILMEEMFEMVLSSNVDMKAFVEKRFQSKMDSKIGGAMSALSTFFNEGNLNERLKQLKQLNK